MSYTDLVTYEEVQERAMSSDRSITDEPPAVVGIISSVSRSIESYLHRRLTASVHTQAIMLEEWKRERIDDTHVAWTEQWPITEVLTDGYTRFDKQKVAGDADSLRVSYIAGYLRQDQEISDLQGQVPQATETPPTLPGDITDVALRLVLYYVSETGAGSLGLGQKEQAVGSGNALTVRGQDPAFVTREMSRLDRYKRRIAL
jgi:hypothetical protein